MAWRRMQVWLISFLYYNKFIETSKHIALIYFSSVPICQQMGLLHKVLFWTYLKYLTVYAKPKFIKASNHMILLTYLLS